MRIENISLKLNSIDILTASPCYFCKKCMETQKENLQFDSRVKGLINKIKKTIITGHL